MREITSYGKQDGKWEYYYPGGVIVATENAYGDGMLNGVSKTYARRGEVQNEIGYKNNKKHGAMKVYNRKGKLMLHVVYKNGVRTKSLVMRGQEAKIMYKYGSGDKPKKNKSKKAKRLVHIKVGSDYTLKIIAIFNIDNYLCKSMIRALLLLSPLLLSICSFAQTATLKGVVVDGNTNETLIGVTVAMVDGPGTVTNLDGEYSLKVSPGSYELFIDTLDMIIKA